MQTLTSLLPHQQAAVDHLRRLKVGALFMDMGTGKSRTVLELAAMRTGKWNRIFWFCPVSLQRTIYQQVLEHTDIAPNDICLWGPRKTNHRAVVHIIGIESMSSSDRLVCEYAALITTASFVIVDESSLIKGHASLRSTRITDLSAKARYRYILNGTPLTEGVVDLFAQMRFLSTEILGYNSFYGFAANHLEYRQRTLKSGRKVRTKQIARSHDTDIIADKIAPYVYQVKKDDCLSLPDKLYETRWFSMTPEQRELYDRTKERMLIDCELHEWDSTTIFRLFAALQTITCGWLQQGSTKTVPHNRTDLLLDVVSEIPDDERVIIWAKYRRSIDEISSALSAEYSPDCVHPFHGDCSRSERDAAIDKWRQHGRFLVATHGVGGRGHTWNEAAYSVFYADGFRYEDRLQSEDRNHRIGQTRRPTYITLRCSDSIDERIAKAHDRKSDVIDDFVRDVRAATANGKKYDKKKF